MTGVTLDEVDDEWIKRTLAGCTCSYAWRGYGRLYGIPLGEGWVRLNDDPGCPHHGEVSASPGTPTAG